MQAKTKISQHAKGSFRRYKYIRGSKVFTDRPLKDIGNLYHHNSFSASVKLVKLSETLNLKPLCIMHYESSFNALIMHRNAPYNALIP